MVHFCTYPPITINVKLTGYRILGCYVAWRLRKQSKLEWLSSNGTQKGQNTNKLPSWRREGYTTLLQHSQLPTI
jgi:hypothetical protein